MTLRDFHAHLPSNFAGSISFREKTGSTNDDAFGELERGAAEPALVVANEQTEGRGRRGHTWLSPADHCLLTSWGFTSEKELESLPLFSPACAVAVAEAMEGLTGMDVGIKWPNDLFIGDFKCGGVLLESRPVRDRIGVVAGIGLNVNVEPGWFEEKELVSATSIAAATGQIWSRPELLGRMVSRMTVTFEELRQGHLERIQENFSQRCWLTGRQVTFECGGQPTIGTVKRIVLDGKILVDVDGVEKGLSTTHTQVLAW